MNPEPKDFQHEQADRSRAARILGMYILLAAIVLGVSALLVVLVLRVSFAGFNGWYYIFLLVIVAAYALYQSFVE